MTSAIPTDAHPRFAIAEMVRHYDEHGRYPDADLREHAIAAFGADVLVSALVHLLTRAVTAQQTTVQEWVGLEVERVTEGIVEDMQQAMWKAEHPDEDE